MSVFITFEGVEGSGKSFQARVLYRKLCKLAIPSILVREPGSTPIGEKLARWLKWAQETNISALTELLMFNACRSQLVDEVIEPNIKGANTDILLTGKAGLRIAVEVALSEHGQLKNIQRDLKDFDRVIMAVERQTILKKIEEEAKKTLSPDFLKRVTFRLLKDFLEKDDGQNH